MSVGITGLIANLPGTLTPYPTQNPALEFGGFQQTASVTTRDLIPANFRQIGMVVITQDDGAAYQLVGGILNTDWAAMPGVATAQAAANTAIANAAAAQTTANTAVTNAAAAQATANTAETDAQTGITNAAAAQTTANTAVTNAAAAQATATAAEQPFKGTYYVDPAFGGTSTGSASNPFLSIAAAFAAAVSLALSACVVRIPPGVTVTENVATPSTAGSWEIACDEGFISSSVGARVTGTLTCNATAANVGIRLTNLIWNGNITGLSSAGFAEFVMTGVRHVGTCTLTTSGAGVWVETHRGLGSPAANKTGGSSSALASAAGAILASNWVFEGGVTEGQVGPLNPPNGSQFHDCQFGTTTGTAVPIGLNGSSANALFLGCYFNGPVTFTASVSNYVISVDPATMASLLSVGVTLVGTGISLKTVDSNASRISTETGNRASTNLGARAPADLYEMVVSSTLLVQGTLGAYQPNAIYTDMTGTLVTVPVGGSLDITAAVGTKSAGSLVFQHNGAAAPLAFSTTGIVTPGAVSIAFGISVRRRS